MRARLSAARPRRMMTSLRDSHEVLTTLFALATGIQDGSVAGRMIRHTFRTAGDTPCCDTAIWKCRTGTEDHCHEPQSTHSQSLLC